MPTAVRSVCSSDAVWLRAVVNYGWTACMFTSIYLGGPCALLVCSTSSCLSVYALACVVACACQTCVHCTCVGIDCREGVLQQLGYTDIFKACKDTENAAALELLPKVGTGMFGHFPGQAQLVALCRHGMQPAGHAR
jgi:hypothetical protein